MQIKNKQPDFVSILVPFNMIVFVVDFQNWILFYLEIYIFMYTKIALASSQKNFLKKLFSQGNKTNCYRVFPLKPQVKLIGHGVIPPDTTSE